MSTEIEHARKCADYFRRLGLCPLPSRMDCKGPALPTYCDHYQGVAVPDDVYRDWRTTNLQLITGTNSPTPTKIVVVDIDSDPARRTWRLILARNFFSMDRQWVVKSGGGGAHYYFSLPPGMAECRSGIVWGLWDTYGTKGKGDWVKHHEIRLIADNSLIIAPPSLHVDTHRPYEFSDRFNPKYTRMPAVAPDWLLAMPRLSTPSFERPKRPTFQKITTRATGTRWFDRDEVLAAVGDRKLDIAITWGLVTHGSENAKGWVCCFVPGREDPKHSRPSGSFHVTDGTFQDRKDLSTISFFDLGVSLGQYKTWQECRDALGDEYLTSSSR